MSGVLPGLAVASIRGRCCCLQLDSLADVLQSVELKCLNPAPIGAMDLAERTTVLPIRSSCSSVHRLGLFFVVQLLAPVVVVAPGHFRIIS